jgi:hypothetical protein
MMANSLRLVHWSVRVYKLLIQAYPEEFCKKYGDEMSLVFRELASDAYRRRGSFGISLMWCRILGDLLRTVPREHGAVLSRRILMKTTIRTILWTLFAAFIHYFVFLSMGMLLFGLIFLLQGGSWLERPDNNSPLITFLKAVIFIPPPFLAGMILARTQPFFRPYLTAPLGIMIIGGVFLCFSGVPANSPFDSSILGYVAYYFLGVVVVGLLGLETLLGCITATKISQRFSKPKAKSIVAEP